MLNLSIKAIIRLCNKFSKTLAKTGNVVIGLYFFSWYFITRFEKLVRPSQLSGMSENVFSNGQIEQFRYHGWQNMLDSRSTLTDNRVNLTLNIYIDIELWSPISLFCCGLFMDY